MSFGWGTVLVSTSLISIFLALQLLQWRLITFIEIRNNNELTALEHIKNAASPRIAYIGFAIILAFSLSTIGSEIEAINIFSNFASTSTQQIFLGEIQSSDIRINIFLIIFCCIYVIVGGYLSVIKTDFFQLFLILALVICIIFYVFYNFEVSELIIKHLEFSTSAWTAAFATSILIFSWVFGVCDNWIRTLGTTSTDLSLEENKKNIKAVIRYTSVFAIFIIATPMLLGLAIRDVTFSAQLEQSRIQCDSYIYSNKNQPNELKTIYDLAKTLKPLATITGDPCSFTAPSHKGSSGSLYKEYTKFTNFPYQALVVFMNGLLNKDHNILIPMIFSVGIILAIISAALTTIDSLLILITQVANNLSIIQKNKKASLLTVFGSSITILTISYAFVFSPSTYLSVGVFAWSCMVFLGGITFIGTLKRSMTPGDQYVKTTLWYISLMWVFWIIISAFPHFYLITGYPIPTPSVSSIYGTVIEFITSRSSMPILAFLIVSLATISAYFKTKFRTGKQNRREY